MAFRGVEVPVTITEEPRSASSAGAGGSGTSLASAGGGGSGAGAKKVQRTPKAIYRPTETTPLFGDDGATTDDEDGLADGRAGGRGGGKGGAVQRTEVPLLDEGDDDVDSGDRIVTVAIWINFAANVILLLGKIAVIISVPSMSVLASLVDAVLDFLSVAIIWITTWLISHHDQYRYPVGRRR